jgi:2'-5' RNA ligase
MPRVFVAIPLPAGVAGALGRVLPDLRGLRRVEPQLMHVTLAFLGQVGDELVPRIVEAVRVAAHANGPFDVEIQAVGAFPGHGPPRTIWAGTSPRAAAAIVRLGASVRAELLRGRIQFDPKPLRAHVTLGRVRDDVAEGDARAIANAVANARVEPTLTFRAASVHVMESELSSRGPLYSSRGELTLAGPPGAMNA